MDSIKTYAVGNGEITLTKHEAEELRIILQTEHLRNVIDELIEQRADCFSFPGPRSRRLFVDDMVRLNEDLIGYDSSYYEEMLIENVFREAENRGIAR